MKNADDSFRTLTESLAYRKSQHMIEYCKILLDMHSVTQ